MAVTVEFVDTRNAAEDLLRIMDEIYAERDREEPPHDVLPTELRLAWWRNRQAHVSAPRWIAIDGGRAVAMAGAWMQREGDPENVFGWVYVLPSRRGEGLGRLMASPFLDYIEEDGRIRLTIDIADGRPEEELALRAGLKKVYREKMSRMYFSDVNWELMQSWVDRAPERAADYDLLEFDAPIPEEHLEAFVEATKIMHTAPKEDAVEEDVDLTADQWRDTEATEAAKGTAIRLIIAVHRPTGHFAGYTIMTFQSLRPEQAWQWDTGVDPAHRNKGLGRWLKAAMVLWAKEHHPEVRFVDTFNAGSNEPMLHINVEMGFKPVRISNAWQGMLTDVRTNLRV